MNYTAQDLFRLRWSILFSLLLALLGSLAVIGSRHFRDDNREAHRLARREGSEIQARLEQVGFGGQNMAMKLARYQEIMRQGYLGQENRLEWLEAIPRISRKLALLDLRYEFSPQQPLDNGASNAFLSSHMKLQMQLLHEEDLINFLAELRASVHAYIRINSCKVERHPRNEGSAGIKALLQADCSLDWITFRET